MATVYSTRAYAGVLAVGTHASVLTVPAGKTLVLRDISASPDTGTTSSLLIILPAIAVVASLVGITAAAPGHWEGRVVFNAGEGVTLVVGGGQLEIYMGGYLLDA